MNFDFEQFGFSIETTLDGSPTLRLLEKLPNSEKPPESMHHSGGAASETLYIYGDPLKQALDYSKAKNVPTEQLKTCVVGLGLAYIEMCWAKAHVETKTVGSCDSFELVIGLQQKFINWLINQDTENFSFDSIYNKCLSHLNVKQPDVVLKLMQHNYSNELNLHRDLLDQENYKNKKWNFICYDAFSRKTNEKLWDEEFLTEWIKNHVETDAVFMTYACLGSLKRALKKNDFYFIKRTGFQGKRDATLALRGIYKDLDLNLFT